jgi:hypothetical protein
MSKFDFKDIVAELRGFGDCVTDQAADEIERLRAMYEPVTAEELAGPIKRLPEGMYYQHIPEYLIKELGPLYRQRKI